MSIHKLLLESNEEPQTTLCIHSAISDVLLVFSLNRELNIRLKRSDVDLDSSETSTGYVLYEFICNQTLHDYRLIGNQLKITHRSLSDWSLFHQTEKTVPLFKSIEQVDYLLTLNQIEDSSSSILSKVSSIKGVISCYELPDRYQNIKHQLTF